MSASFPEPPGDGEGAWAGEPGLILEGGGQIASRGTGDIPLPADAASVLDSITDVTGVMSPKLYTFDAAGNRTAAPRRGVTWWPRLC
jgi:hypothetical protein